MTSNLRPFFAPQGVALIGASDNPSKLSHGILKNMVSYGYQGAVYPVNPKSTRILGLACYPDIRQVPDPVDLAVIIIPAPLVPEALEACGERGIRAAIIISGGFKEVGLRVRLWKSTAWKLPVTIRCGSLAPTVSGRLISIPV